jgi:hypothetical protein
MICSLANSLWLAGCLPEFARFRRAITRVREEQESVLQRVLRANADTELGSNHRFASIRSVRDFQQQVPLRKYEDFQPWIDRIADGSQNVLTRETVRVLQPTSGSSGASKLIPYTRSLQREFQRGIRPWIADLFLHRPELMSGQAYWSVSPATVKSRRSAGGIPIGFDDDASYVGAWQRRFVDAVMAVPSSVSQVSDIDEFRHRTLQALIRSKNLRLISVWNPTFLSLLIPDVNPADLWPNLKVISCWTDANAAGPAANLRKLFPHAEIQPKGLISTEAFISFPLTGHDGAALAVRSHFLEFIPLDDDMPRLAHELEEGQQYSVVVTTGGGLYRYQTDDVVEVVGRVRECPLIRFVGRKLVSDRVGEKLNEAHVGEVLRATFAAFGITPSFAMLAFDETSYVLYIDTEEPDLDAVVTRIETELRRNFHYDYARLLGQLGPLRVLRVNRGAEKYFTAAVAAGQRAGDVKPVALSVRTAPPPHPSQTSPVPGNTSPDRRTSPGGCRW